MAFNDEKYSFEFESLLKLKKHTWMIGVQIPIKGEELLTLNYQTKVLKLNNKRIKTNYNHLDKLNKRKVLGLFINKLILFLNLYEEINDKKITTRSGKHEDIIWNREQDKLNIMFPIDKNLLVTATFSELSDRYYHQISWALSDKNNYGFHHYPFKLNLYLDGCATQKIHAEFTP
ncbi:MAG: hypothetical protein HOJ35_06195 [Bdellovibrionales bacterium]|nr:hypothetical protein [Bdellovibrionales bacterium]